MMDTGGLLTVTAATLGASMGGGRLAMGGLVGPWRVPALVNLSVNLQLYLHVKNKYTASV